MNDKLGEHSPYDGMTEFAHERLIEIHTLKFIK
jgi:hypothetical protein